MKKTAQSKKGGGLSLWDWVAYGAAGLLLLAGQAVLLNGNVMRGALVSAVGVLVVVARLSLPRLPWALLLESAKNAVKLAAKLKQRKVASSNPKAVKPKPSALALSWKRRFPDDVFSISRHWLGLPLGLLVVLMQFAILKGSITRGAVYLALSGLIAAIYLHDLNRPLVLPKLSRNLKTLLLFLPALPFEVFGALMLWNYTHVWLGYFLTVLGTSWMLWVLKKYPFDLVEDPEATSDQLDYTPETPWFSSNQVAVKTGLVAGAAVCAYLSLQVLGSAQAGLRVLMGFLGIALFIASFPWFPYGLSSLSVLPKAARAWIVLGMALLAFAIGSHAQNLMESGHQARSLWYFLFAGVILVAAMSRFRGLEALEAGRQDSSRWPLKSEIFWVALLIVASFQFRWWNIEWFPYGAEGDEAGGGVWAMDALRGSVEHPLIHQNYPLHFFSVTALFFKLFGVTLATMRWHSVIFGTMSVAASYFFARLFFGRWTAFLSTLLMSFAYWHLHYSRFGHYNIEQVFAQTAAFYFVFKGMKTGQWKHFFISGLAFALAMFPHMAGRLLPFEGLAFVGYLLLLRRDLFRQRFSGLLTFVLGAWLIASPAVTYWLRATTISMGRIQSVSIFDKNNSNAPVDVLAGFVQNCKVSILMFNDYSDSRTRDNPLAPQKILEHWSAILFALAFCYVLYHWRDPVNFFLLGCFFINLSASVFSVEAPQTLRTAGNIPMVFAIIAVLLAHFHRSLIELGWRWGTAVYAGVLVPSLAFFSYRSAQKYFVEAGRLAFDVHPTYIAQVAGLRGNAQTQAVFWATGFASSHPPVVLFTQQTPIRNFYNLAEYLPITDAASKDHILFLADDYARMMPYLKFLYPEVKAEVLKDRLGGQDLAQYMVISKGQLQAIQGLKLEGSDAAGKPFNLDAAALEFPQEGVPASAKRLHFSGSLIMDLYGDYHFSAAGKGACEIRVAGKLAFSRGPGGSGSSAKLRLPRGPVPISVDFRPSGAGDYLRVTANGTPTETRYVYALRGSTAIPIIKSHLFKMAPKGILGHYYGTRDWSGPEIFSMIEPGIFAHYLDSPMTGNWSVRYKARLRVDKPGNYVFRMSGPSTEVRVDGKLAFRGGPPIRPEMKPPVVPPQTYLSKGSHDLEALFSTSGPPGMDLSWRGPDGIETVITAENLDPQY